MKFLKYVSVCNVHWKEQRLATPQNNNNSDLLKRGKDVEAVKENLKSESEVVLGSINMIVVICIRKESSN